MSQYDALGAPAPPQPQCPTCGRFKRACDCPRKPCPKCDTPLWVYHGDHFGLPCLTARVERLERAGKP